MGSCKTTVEIGDIFLIKANEENGITPKYGDVYRQKFFIVMGKAPDGSIYGCVHFNSDLNREYIAPGYEEFYLPISDKEYSFLDHDSYIDCVKLKVASESKLLSGIFMGQIKQIHYKAIKQKVCLSPRNESLFLRMLGL